MERLDEKKGKGIREGGIGELTVNKTTRHVRSKNQKN